MGGGGQYRLSQNRKANAACLYGHVLRFDGLRFFMPKSCTDCSQMCCSMFDNGTQRSSSSKPELSEGDRYS